MALDLMVDHNFSPGPGLGCSRRRMGSRRYSVRPRRVRYSAFSAHPHQTQISTPEVHFIPHLPFVTVHQTGVAGSVGPPQVRVSSRFMFVRRKGQGSVPLI